MRRAQAIALLVAAMCTGAPPSDRTWSGSKALEWTRRIVALGPRPVASEAHRRMEAMIVAEARRRGCSVEEDVWTAQTPFGPKPMKNIVARVQGASGRVVVLSGHYDTKLMQDELFVGANDGGSSTGFLLEMARVLCGQPRQNAVWLVWLDGEESLRPQWSGDDNLYGSRRLAARWKSDGTARRIQALLNVDMIGDRDLQLVRELNSTPWLRELVWETARELGFSGHFSAHAGAIEDDHVPFLLAGIPALDLIDFDYGPANEWWHTSADTVDKLSARSFDIVGRVVLKTLEKLEGMR